MLQVIWDTRGYFFWLLVVSALCATFERIRPWRADQRMVRRQFGQDLFWLFFNGHFAGILVARFAAFLFAGFVPVLEPIRSVRLIGPSPWWVQFLVFLIMKDLLEWCVHNLLHRVPWLWEFHKVHHSIEELDWIGNFRFHWMEIVVYQGITYLPLVILGARNDVILAIAVASTLIGHLNHSNLNLSWGPLRFLVNSPRMHVWHHDLEWPVDRPNGVNFGIVLSAWDWLFGTAHWPNRAAAPEQQPRGFGFRGMSGFPRSLVGRFFYPLSRIW
jgi:sterol desaturase/sphingolipid hydroxylase (fatty acid hydroxylase superfamily)